MINNVSNKALITFLSLVEVFIDYACAPEETSRRAVFLAPRSEKGYRRCAGGANIWTCCLGPGTAMSLF